MLVAWITPILVSLLVGAVIAVAVAGIRVWASEKNPTLVGSILIALLSGAVVLGVWAGFSSFTTIDSGTVGVITRFGAVDSEVILNEGLNWKTPFVEKIVVVEINNKTYQTASEAKGKGNFNDIPIDTNTLDGQRIPKATFNMTFFVERGCAPYIVTEFGSVNNLAHTVVIPKSRAIARDHMKEFTAEQLQQFTSVTTLNENTLAHLQRELKNFCVTVTSYEVRDIDFNTAYLEAIEAQQIAEERIQTASYEADVKAEEARGKVIEANNKAEVLLIDANAQAEATIISAEAEAEALRLVGTQLEKFPNYTQLQFVEKLAPNINWGVLPSGVTPLLELPAVE